jgi:uncharacterized membrane protein YhhN
MLRKVLISLIIISAVSAIYADYIGSSLYTFLKPITTGIIIGSALLFKNNSSKKYVNLIVVGLIFCLIGDVLLLEEAQFVWGLGAFVIGHFLFSEAFRSFKGITLYYKELGILSALGVVVFSLLFADLGEFMVPALLYIGVIVYMGWMGICFHKSKVFIKSKWIPMAVSLFMFSDILISLEKFKWPSLVLGAPILITYWISIYLIGDSITRNDEDSNPEEAID